MTIADVEQRCRLWAEEIAHRTLAWLPVSPSALTVAGMLFNIPAAVLLAWGKLPWGAAVMLLAAAFDVVDGAVARATDQESALGAFLDSTLDRFSEVVIGLGLLIHLLQRGIWVDLVLLHLFLLGSMLFSYIRARAEAQGFHSQSGLFRRPLRVFLLGIGLLIGQLRPTLWLLAIGVTASVLHRLLGVCLEARGLSRPEAQRLRLAWLKAFCSRWSLWS